MNYKNETIDTVREKYNYPFTLKPFEHQAKALDKSWFKDNFALFMEMGCVDGETEFLSPAGWVKFKDFDINKPVKVAQIDVESRDVYFVIPEAFIDQPCEEFIHFKCNTVDMMLTPEHTCYVEKRFNGEFNKYVMDHHTAEDLYNRAWGAKNPKGQTIRAYKFPTDFNYKGNKDTNLKLSEYQLRIQVAAMADGHFPNKDDRKCVINLRKERKKERLRWLLLKEGLYFLEKPRKFKGKNYTEFTFQAPMRVKYYDDRFWLINEEQKRIICDECVRWDGSVIEEQFNKDKKYIDYFFYSTNKKSADFIQWCFASLGFRVSLNTRLSDNYTEGKYYTVKINDKNRCSRENKTISWAEQVNKVKVKNGRKYCFRVPTEHLLLRRNDEIFITGNSGKTKVLLDTAGMLYRDNRIDSVVIIAPKGVYSNWVHSEIPAHVPADMPKTVIHWISDEGVKYKKAMDYYATHPQFGLEFFVINVESLQYKGGEVLEKFIKNRKKTLVIIDESTCIKNHEAKRTKRAIELGRLPSVKYKRIATGSPITNSPVDLYAQCGFMDKSLLGHGSYYSFRGTYCILEPVTISGGATIMKPVGVKNLEELTKKLESFSFRVQKNECMDLPDKVFMTREVTLTDEQREAYNQMVKEAIAYFDDNEMTANIAVTKLMRLHQIVCGSFKDDMGKLHRLPNNRLEVLKETLQEIDGKVIIFANYRDNIIEIKEMLQKEYGQNSVVTYFGDTTTEERTYAVQQFDRKYQGDKEPSLRFFVGNTQTAGYGITLTDAKTVIYYSNDYSLERRLQSEDRAHRAGQINKVTYIDLISRKTVDEKIIKSLISKKNLASTILQDEVSDWLYLV